MSGEKDFHASTDPRWQPLTDSAGNVITITPMQCAAILNALRVYGEVSRKEHRPTFDWELVLSILEFMHSKSVLMGRLLYDGQAPLVDAPPTVMAAPDYRVELPPVSSVGGQ